MSSGSWGRAAWAAVLLLWLGAAACTSDESRARAHLEKANEFLESGQRAEATLEYRSALRFDPRSVEANNRLAEIELANGNLRAALAYMQEAYRLDPTDSDAALNLAGLLRGEQPDRAEALVEAVIEREPDNPAGYVGRSAIALERGQVREAVVAARKAMEIAPDDPAVDWNYGYVLQGMIRQHQITGELVEESVYTEALNSFERYIAKGGEAPWNAQIEEARIMAAWPTKGREAAAMFRIALQNALDNGSRADRLRAASQTAGFAREVNDADLLEWSLERLLELEPRDLRSWHALSDVYQRSRRDPQEVWKRLLETLPDDPQAHIEYARFTVHQWKLDEALAYLEAKAAEGIDPPMLLAAIASTQIAAGRLPDARATVRRLERDHPSAPRTAIARAQLDMRQGQVPKAARSLRQLTEQHPLPEAFRLLARAEEVLDREEEALAAINRAIELTPYFSYDDQRVRARLLAASGDCPGSVRNLLAIREQMPLADDDQVLLARCRYEAGSAVYARKLLSDLLATRRPPIEAILLFSQRESGDPESAQLARRELETFLRRQPRHWDAVRELTRLDVAEGRRKIALERLDRLFAANRKDVPAPVLLLRAQLSADEGREAGILEDAKAAFEAQPRLRGAFELLVTVYLRRSDVAAAIAAGEQAQRVGALDDSRRLLLGQLYRMGDRNEEALQLFEKAIAAGTEDPTLYYQMGLALRSLNRAEEAAQAFEKALSISTSFPEANDARRALEGTRSAGAS
jgi:tetratricopeptide (TPR) repeat protein